MILSCDVLEVFLPERMGFSYFTYLMGPRRHNYVKQRTGHGLVHIEQPYINGIILSRHNPRSTSILAHHLSQYLNTFGQTLREPQFLHLLPNTC